MSYYAELIRASGPVDAAVLNRVADWIEANPDKHVAGELAANGIGIPCEPLDPDARCFCVLGRIAVETNGDADDWNLLVQRVGIDGANHLWHLNDYGARERQVVIGRLHQGNPAVVAVLRRLASGDEA